MKENKGLEITFVFIYLIEQLALIILASFYAQYWNFYISIFPVIFLSTIAIEKILLKHNYETQIEDLLKSNKQEKKIHKEFEEFKISTLKR